MNILVTGSSGQLGTDVVDYLKSKGCDFEAPTHSEMHIESAEEVENYFSQHKIDAVIHCAAYTKVDLAEDEIEECRRINVDGTKHIANCCHLYNIPLMYISSDYVFDGTGVIPWNTYDRVNPINVYGKSKADGESIVGTLDKYYIVRISWVFGLNGNNFVKTMLRVADNHDVIRVVDDQVGSPTYTKDAAVAICNILFSGIYGIYHVHNAGECSWFEFAKWIFAVAGRDVNVIPIVSSDYPTKAVRPKNSRLKLVLNPGCCYEMPDWHDAVERYYMDLNCGRE